MNKDWSPTSEQFDKLLAWLDPDRERAGAKYEAIRLGLIKFFAARNCNPAEELADETINRVLQRVEQLVKIYKGDPARYFTGVARKILLEDQREQSRLTPFSALIAPAMPEREAIHDQEILFACLELCLQRLNSEDCNLILLYYQLEKQAKIDYRKVLAEQIGSTPNALRVRVHRLRNILHACVSECLKRSGQA